jgi:hypothetical protein
MVITKSQRDAAGAVDCHHCMYHLTLSPSLTSISRNRDKMDLTSSPTLHVIYITQFISRIREREEEDGDSISTLDLSVWCNDVMTDVFSPPPSAAVPGSLPRR